MLDNQEDQRYQGEIQYKSYYKLDPNQKAAGDIELRQGLVSPSPLNQQTRHFNFSPIDDKRTRELVTDNPEDKFQRKNSLKVEQAEQLQLQFSKNLYASPQTQTEQQQRRIDPKFWIFTIAAVLFFASSAILRSQHGPNIFLTNTIINMQFFISAFIFFAIKFFQMRNKGQKFHFPWYKKVDIDYNQGSYQLRLHPEYYELSKYILICMFLGGSCEFFGSQSLIVSFKHAKLSGMNQGICGALTSSNTLYVLIFSVIIFKERITVIQIFGLILMVLGVVIVSLFKSKYQLDEEQIGIDESSFESVTEDDISRYRTYTIVGGILASVFFGSQLLIFKFIQRVTQDSFGVAFGFLFFASLYGFLNLFYLILFDFQQFFDHNAWQYITTILTGSLLSLGIVSINVSCSYGLMGISNAMMHCNSIIITIFNYFVFGQDINTAQALGIGCCVIASIIISNADRFKRCNKTIGG
eukprot:403351819